MSDSSSSADFIVVGSGCAGAQAAQTLCEAGADVLLLDVGYQNTDGDFVPASAGFDEIRKSDLNQSRYFLGKNFEGALLSSLDKPAAFTPDRDYVVQGVEELIPIAAKKFVALESLALGGLGNAWGLGCHVFSDNELNELGLNPASMQKAYSTVCERIGISAPSHDVAKYVGGEVENFQKELEVDDNAKAVLKAYHNKRATFNEQGFFAGKPALALLSEAKGVGDDARAPTSYRDMDFWDDFGRSAYRPKYTIERLKKNLNFKYRSHALVLGFREKPDYVEVVCFDLLQGEQVTFKAQKLVLAAGALASARISLRSLDKTELRLPFVANPFSYVGCLQPRMLGRVPNSKKTSLAQLVFFFDPEFENFNSVMCSFFSYKSLLLNKLAGSAFLSFKDSVNILSKIQSAFSVVTVNHAEYPSEQKYVCLKPDAQSFTGDRLHLHYVQSKEEQERIAFTEKKIKRYLRGLGCLPFQTLRRPNGASVHYAGTLPLDVSGNSTLFTQQNGVLSSTKRVYVADASAFRYLPAKGPTFSIMAYAHSVALQALREAR